MRSLGYLNGVLTVLAVLLALNLWLELGQGGPRLPQAEAAGVTNAGQQRQEMIGLLKKANSRMSDVLAVLEDGRVEVVVRQDQPEGE